MKVFFGFKFLSLSLLLCGLASIAFIAGSLLEFKDAIAVGVAMVSALIAGMMWHLTTQRNRKDATDKIFEEWWGKEAKDLRRYFLSDFLVNSLHSLNGCSLKEVEDRVEKDDGRLHRLCHFFDRVGWLASAGLINADDVMGPMQHSMRRLWMTIEPLVEYERSRLLADTPLFDPVYYRGFEWLYRRSSSWWGNQAILLYRTGMLSSPLQAIKMRDQIKRSEDHFQRYLQQKRRSKRDDLNEFGR